MNTEVLFNHDNNVLIKLINNPLSIYFASRPNHEVLFRKLHAFLISNNIILNNIIDLGAWIGDNSMPWAKLINGIVYAIDPSSNNINYIKDMCELNDIKNIKCIQTAISHKNETLSTNENIDHCSFVYNNPLNNGNIKKDAVSLNWLYESGIIKDIGYIHLDVEGMEYRVLLGSTKIIEKFKPIITFEQHLELDDYNIILNFLKERNYIVFLIDEVLPGCRPDCRNSIAFHQNIFSQNILDEINISIGNILIKK